MKSETAKAIKKLKQALLNESYRETAKAYKALHDIGDCAAPALLSELEGIDLEKVEYPIKVSLVAGLATALHDLDPDKSTKFIETALSRPCNAVIASSLRIINRYRHSDFRETQYLQLTIFEEKAIDERYNATTHVIDWLEKLPPQDLVDLSRIYIITDKSHYDFLGAYQPFMSVITLIWETSFDPNLPIQWLFRIGHHKTLYHEIGHHREKHVEYGQVPEQERQADAYALTAIKKTRPGWAKFVGLLEGLRGLFSSSSRQ